MRGRIWKPDLDYRCLVEKPEFNVYWLHLADRPWSRIAREFIGVLRQTIEAAQS